MEAVTSSDRSYCTTCGWLLPAGARATCAACGGDATPLPLADNARPVPREDDDHPALASAKDAWAHGDHVRAIGQALTFAAEPRAFPAPQGPGWVAAVGATPVFVFLDHAISQITLEIPVVRLPQTKRAPALRAALAFCNETAAASRFCLRLDLLVVRFVSRLDVLSAATLRKLAREMASSAARAQEILTSAFDARPAIPEHGTLSAWDRLGRAQTLPALAPASAIPPPSSAVRPESSRPSARPSSRPASMNVMQAVPVRPITLRLSIPPALAHPMDDDMPAVLAPDFADDPPASSSASAKYSTMPPPSRPMDPPVSPRPSMLPSALASTPALGLRGPFATSNNLRPVSESGGRAAPPPLPSMPDAAEGAPPSRRAVRPPPQDPALPENRLCELLRQALALATALSFEEKPHTMLLLVRAAVFRAVHEHQETLPTAVAYLVRSTRQVTREIWSTKAEPGRGTGPIPVAEPALGSLEQVIAARAQFPREKPASVEPWTSAIQAKENLAKYLAEIEISPLDPMLRHYLALGALSELLCRTRLPAQTEQRLREIVSYAQRDGSKPQVIELMMTALRKIVSG